MPEYFFNQTRNIFIYLLSLQLNIIRAVSGFILGVDVFIFACVMRPIIYWNLQARIYLNLQAPIHRRTLLYIMVAISLHIYLLTSFIIRYDLLYSLILGDQSQTILLSQLTYVFSSLMLENLQTDLKFLLRKVVDSTLNNPMATIGSVMFFAMITVVLISLVSPLLDAYLIISNTILCVYLNDMQVSICNLPMVFAKKLTAVGAASQYSNVILRGIYRLFMPSLFQDRVNNYAPPNLAIYLAYINQGDMHYFVHNHIHRQGKITLNNQGIDDSQIAEFIQALECRPDVAKYIINLDLQGNNITSIKIPSKFKSLERLNISGNKLKHISIAEGLTKVKQILLDDNYLKDIIISQQTLNRLENLSIARNPLTAATRYSLQQLHGIFPNLSISGLQDNHDYDINETMLENHVEALIPYSLQPPTPINIMPKEIRRAVHFLTQWMDSHAESSSQQYDRNLCSKILSYVYIYPVTPQQAITRISKSLNMIKFTMTPINLREKSDAITAFNNFVAKSQFYGVAAQGLIEQKINNNFHSAIKREVNDAENILQRRRLKMH